MDVVAYSEDERVLLIVLEFPFLDLVLRDLGRKAWQKLESLGVVNEQVHASLLVVEGNCLG